MKIINRKTILTSTATILIITLAFPYVCFVAQVRGDTTFEPTDKFDIPSNNSTVSFSIGGTYKLASLENVTWSFVGLRFNNSQQPKNLEVSAQDSNVTITSYQTFNFTFQGAFLVYIVEGQGKQTFNIGVIPKGGELSVSFNNVFMGENDGWSISWDGTVTITGATSHSNVTIVYYTLPDPFGDSSNLPIYQQHSVAIVTAVATAVAVVLAVTIRKKAFSAKAIS